MTGSIGEQESKRSARLKYATRGRVLNAQPQPNEGNNYKKKCVKIVVLTITAMKIVRPNENDIIV